MVYHQIMLTASSDDDLGPSNAKRTFYFKVLEKFIDCPYFFMIELREADD